MPFAASHPFRRPLAAAAALTLAGAACQSATDPGPGGTPTPIAGIRFVQVVSDAAGGVDVGINGTTAGTALQFGTFAPQPQGAYVRVPVGPTVTLAATGAPTPFYTQALAAVTAGNAYTLVALGNTASGANPAATLGVLADTLPGAAPSGVLVRAFNAVDYLAPAGGDPVDVYVYAQGAARPAAPAVAGLAWNARSPYLTVAGGNVQVDVLAAGAPAGGAPLFTTSFNAANGAVRTLILRDPPGGSVAGTSGTVLVLNDVN